MPRFHSSIAISSPEYQHNYQAQLRLIENIRELEQKVCEHSHRQIEKFRLRGQLLPRERLSHLLDCGAPFIELSTLAGYNMHDDDGKDNVYGGGVITGIGYVQGVRCAVSVNDSAIKGGTITPMGLKKSLRLQQIALENKLPVINLVESGGANLLYQAEIFVDGGRIFANMARLSAAGIPQITVVHGSSTAGGAYLPGLSDVVVVVRKRAKIFLAGPPLVQAATGEVTNDEDLGGADLHATVTGTAEYLAEDDAHAIAYTREIMAKLAWNRLRGQAIAPTSVREPLYTIDELLGIVPTDFKKPYDVREVIARLVDGSDFLEFKANYGSQLLCVHASIAGYACGIIGNNGPIDPNAATKAAQFIQLCCQSQLPIIYLQNTTGYMVGSQAERAGMVKHGSKMIQAVANATVPQITLILGASFGAGNYGMCGRSYDPRFIFAWPASKIAVMGGEQAARVLEIIGSERMSAVIRTRIEQESTALYATARLWDDGIIDPRDSRRMLAQTLAICHEASLHHLHANTFGVARM